MERGYRSQHWGRCPGLRSRAGEPMQTDSARHGQTTRGGRDCVAYDSALQQPARPALFRGLGPAHSGQACFDPRCHFPVDLVNERRDDRVAVNGSQLLVHLSGSADVLRAYGRRAAGGGVLRDVRTPGEGVGLSGRRHALASGCLDLVVSHRVLFPVVRPGARPPSSEHGEREAHARAVPLLSSNATASAGLA
jgi:hypothetical protein